MEQMAKWKEFPSPEAIVRAALEQAAKNIEARAEGERKIEIYSKEKGRHYKAREAAHFARCLDQIANIHIRRLASDPAEVAAIIAKAGEQQ
jgi:hypothetical protein